MTGIVNEKILINLIRMEKYDEFKAIVTGNSIELDKLNYCHPVLELTEKDNYDLDMMKFIVEHGGQINEKNKLGFTPIMNVSYVCRSDIAKYLIKNGADVNSKTNLESTPLMNCCCGTYFTFDYFFLLLENGADPTICDKDGESIYEYAKSNSIFRKEHLDFFKKVSSHKMNISEIRKEYKKIENIQFKKINVTEKVKISFNPVRYSIEKDIKKSNYSLHGDLVFSVDKQMFKKAEDLYYSKQYEKASYLLDEVFYNTDISRLDIYKLWHKILAQSLVLDDALLVLQFCSRVALNYKKEQYLLLRRQISLFEKIMNDSKMLNIYLDKLLDRNIDTEDILEYFDNYKSEDLKRKDLNQIMNYIIIFLIIALVALFIATI